MMVASTPSRAIRLIPANREKLTQVLARLNKSARTHVFDASMLLGAAEQAERELDDLAGR